MNTNPIRFTVIALLSVLGCGEASPLNPAADEVSAASVPASEGTAGNPGVKTWSFVHDGSRCSTEVSGIGESGDPLATVAFVTTKHAGGLQVAITAAGFGAIRTCTIRPAGQGWEAAGCDIVEDGLEDGLDDGLLTEVLGGLAADMNAFDQEPHAKASLPAWAVAVLAEVGACAKAALAAPLDEAAIRACGATLADVHDPCTR